MLRPFLCAATLMALGAVAHGSTPAGAEEPPHSPVVDAMIKREARRHGVPEKLIRRIVMRESKYNAHARNRSYWGLMQISYPTARSMGFKGSPQQLLDPIVNLTYAVPYLANAFIIAGKQEDAAVRLYASGYYATAKARHLLGDLRTAESPPLVPEESIVVATARPAAGLITTLMGGTPQPAPQQPMPQIVAAQQPLQPQVALAPAQPVGPPPQLGAGLEPGRPADVAKAGPNVSMTAGKDGNAEPPKKWLHDGGMTLVGRGEQPVDQVAAYTQVSDTIPDNDSPRHARRHHAARKSATFAALDAPPASAQAYAGAEAAQAPAPSQAAIAAATAAAPPVQAQPVEAIAAQGDEPGVAETRHHHVRHDHKRVLARKHSATTVAASEPVAPPAAAATAPQ